MCVYIYIYIPFINISIYQPMCQTIFQSQVGMIQSSSMLFLTSRPRQSRHDPCARGSHRPQLKVRRQQVFINSPSSGLSLYPLGHHAHIQRSVTEQQCHRAKRIWSLQDFCERCATWVEGPYLPLTRVSNIDCSTFNYELVL